MLSITADNRVTIGEPTGWVWSAVSGKPVLLREGRIADSLPDSPQDPRTAVAIDRTGRRMFWLMIDGRQPKYSEGVTFAELAEICREVGGWDALALDGGGSSTLVARDANGEPTVLNCPIHGKHPPGVERPVANHLGMRIRPLPRP